ncbi:MAG: hypothetical protein OXI63_05780 [Candidatus Poribacteria bacterium]|nr:hypothetical protein [Candidatus Poribacteria bacterium]
MFLLLISKTIRHITACLVFFTCLTTASAQQKDSLPVLPQNAIDAENDFNMILLGMRNYDGAALSGEGECLYVFRQPGTPDAYRTWKARLTFDPWHTRMDFKEGFSNNTQTPRVTLISSPSGTLEITYAKAEEPSYHFRGNSQVSENLSLKSQTEIKLDASRDWVDPRRWLHSIDGRALPTYLKEQNFRILKSEFFNGFPCYVLEAKQPNQQDSSFEKIWVSPELGLRYLQYESRFLSAVDSADGQIKKGTPAVRRIRLSYGLYGEDAWFVTNGIAETFWIDADGEKHLINRAIIETQNFIVNHEIPLEVFTVDLPDNATIQVGAEDKKLSPEEFRQWYDEIHFKGIKLIKD